MKNQVTITIDRSELCDLLAATTKVKRCMVERDKDPKKWQELHDKLRMFLDEE